MSWGGSKILTDHELGLVHQIHRFRGSEGCFSGGVYWKKVSRSTLIATPDAFDYGVRVPEVYSVLRRTGSVLAQFATRAATGTLCNHYVLRDRSYGEQSLQRQFRQTLYRARKHFVARRLDWGEVSECALRVIHESRPSESGGVWLDRMVWEDLCLQMDRSQRFEAIGCFDGHALVAIDIFCNMEGCYTPIVNASIPRAMALGVSNLLIFESLRYLIQKTDCQSVSLGRTGIPEKVGISRFKRHAGLIEEPVRIAVLLHPRWRWLVHASRLSGVFQVALGKLGLNERFREQMAGLQVAVATRPELLPG